MNGLNGFLQNDIPDLGLLGPSIAMGIIEEVGRLPKNDPRRRAFFNKMRVNSMKKYAPVKNLTAKAEFEKRLNMLPANIVNDINQNVVQIVDGSLYGVRLIGGLSSVEIFANADDKTVSITNINARKLEKDTPFLVTALRLTAGVGAAGDSSQADISGTTFAKAAAAILNGEISVEVGKKVLLPETHMGIFDTNTYSENPVGYYKLENPKWISPQQEIVTEIKLGSAAAAKTYLKVEFLGATVAKN